MKTFTGVAVATLLLIGAGSLEAQGPPDINFQFKVDTARWKASTPHNPAVLVIRRDAGPVLDLVLNLLT